MNSLKNTFVMLMIAAGLLGAGCEDDDKATDNGGNGGGNDAGGNGGDGGGNGGVDLTISCLAGGIYDGVKAQQIFDKITEGGACATDVQVAQICEVNPSTAAAESGRACYSAGLQEEEALKKCTVDGDPSANAAGIRAAAPELTDACMYCFAGSVACSAQNCLGSCLDPKRADECVKCREDNDCTPTFYACSGLPRLEELQ